jgi:hypothetical protein
MDQMKGPWAGYQSLEEAVEALRRATFRIEDSFELAGRGLVIRGDIIDGSLKAGMILVPRLERYSDTRIGIPIRSVESVRVESDVGIVALIVDMPDPSVPSLAPQLAPGTLLDVLERSPAA